MLHPKDVMESESYQLARRATALKRAGDMSGAIAALRRIKELHGEFYSSTRLAKYLQRNNQTEESLHEIDWLLERSESLAVELFGHQPRSLIDCQLAGIRGSIHHDAALICRRAKLFALQAQHEQLRDEQWAMKQRLKPIADADVKEALAKRRAALTHRQRPAEPGPNGSRPMLTLTPHADPPTISQKSDFSGLGLELRAQPSSNDAQPQPVGQLSEAPSVEKNVSDEDTEERYRQHLAHLLAGTKSRGNTRYYNIFANRCRYEAEKAFPKGAAAAHKKDMAIGGGIGFLALLAELFSIFG